MSYGPLVNYIDKLKVGIITTEYNNNYKNFRDKYFDQVVNAVINSIKMCDLKKIFKDPEWRFRFTFFDMDIENIDRDNPNNGQYAVNEFFLEVCKELKIEMRSVKYVDTSKPEENKVTFECAFKNPL